MSYPRRLPGASPPPLLLLLLLVALAVSPPRPTCATMGGGLAVVRPEAAPSAAVWSKFGLVVQKNAPGEPAHTTETSGIIMRAPDPQQTPRTPLSPESPTALGKSWTQISVTPPPKRSSPHVQVTASTPVRFTGPGGTAFSTTTARSMIKSDDNSSAALRMRDIPSRYQSAIGTSKPVITITFPPPRMPTIRPSAVSTEVVTSKRVRQYEDDDDDDDDDDEDDEYDVVDDDDDEVHEDKNDEEEIEEIVEVQHIDSDSYGDEKPAIIKKKRRRKKKGKKSKPFKVKDFKKLKKFMLPLLLAYKLKFFTLVPLMLGGLVLIVATTGFAGFFFALFAVGLGLKGHR